MNQSIVNPALAPSFGVTTSSPEPTIDAVMIKPGPSCRTIPPKVVGAGRSVDEGGGCVVFVVIRKSALHRAVDGDGEEFAL
jgi:hypothetical protein